MSWFSKKKKKKEPIADIDWEARAEQGRNYQFKGKIFGKDISLSPQRLQFIAFIIAFAIVILFIRNLFYLFQNIDIPNNESNYSLPQNNNEFSIDSNIIEFQKLEQRMSSDELRINSILKKKAYDSLIDNQILSPETSRIVEEMYPDSICGC